MFLLKLYETKLSKHGQLSVRADREQTEVHTERPWLATINLSNKAEVWPRHFKTLQFTKQI